jgi:hypothetical protein
LYASRVEVLRITGPLTAGTPSITWSKVDDIVDVELGEPGEMLCRLDLGFIRTGRDLPMPVTAGRAPDRTGVCFFDPPGPRAGDRLRCIAGPVTGTFEIRAIPDPAVDFSSVHHLEVQVVEVAQALVGVFPSGSPGEDL